MRRPSRSTAQRRWVVVASRFNEAVVDRLLEAALACFGARGVRPEDVVVVRVPGAFELPQAAAWAAARRPRVAGIVALGAVIRGQTPHFDHVCSAAAHGLMDVALRSGLPLGFGVLTCDTAAQAVERAGGSRGNKGYEAAAAALDLAAALKASAIRPPGRPASHAPRTRRRA